MTEIFKLASIMLCSLNGPSFEYPEFTDCKIITQYAFENNVLIENPESFVREEILSINGSNRYTMFYNNDIEFLIDKESNSVCNVSKGYSIYLNNDNYCLIYYGGNFLKYSPFKNGIALCDSEEYYSFDEYHYYSGSFYEIPEIIAGSSLPDDATVIDNWFYFKNLHRNGDNEDGDVYYGNNRGRECGVVATQILLGYYDTFYNDNIVAEQYELIGKNKTNSERLEDFFSPGTGTRVDDDPFKEYLKNSFCVSTIDDCGISCDQLASMAKSYLNTRSALFDVEFSTIENWVFDVQTYAKNMIDHNNPVILCGAHHNVVAYAYDDEYFYVEDGNGDYCTAVPFWVYNAPPIFDIGNFLSTGCFGIDIHNHVHSNNYYSTINDIYYCPCGEKIKKVTISPNEWGFEAQYFFYEKNKLINKNSLSIETHRLRTGFIENEVVNLSPRRQNAGLSYLKLECNKNIFKFSVDMGWWSNNESIEDASTCLWYKDNLNENSWYNFFDIKNDISLPTSYLTLQTFDFFMPEISNGIMFYNSNSPLGDRNKGRLSIGNMEIWYFADDTLNI